MFSKVERHDRGFFGHAVRLGRTRSYSAFGAAADDLSVIGAGLTVAGDLRSVGEIRVFGAIHGEINSRIVIVAEGGHVEGWIYATQAYIMGSVTGRIEAMEVTVASTATIFGDIYHHVLSVDPDAVLDGLRPWRPRSHLAERRPWHPGE